MKIVDAIIRPLERLIRPKAGRVTVLELEDRTLSGFAAISPERVAAILRAADSGDVEEMALLARELPEKNESIAHALETRRNAVTGCGWIIDPGDESPEAAEAAKTLKRELDNSGGDGLDSFSELIDDLTGALLPGFCLSEIVWTPGGGIAGFSRINPELVSFYNSFEPRIRTTDNFQGEELPPNKFVFHHLRRRGQDPARGGLIRPLAWLYCFANINMKDLLGYVERYGMPFFVVKVSADTWEQERRRLKQIIQKIGSSGGAVVSNTTSVEAVQGGAQNGDAYFKLLDYLEKAITKVILGQTATAGDGGGWSNDGAQSQVRQDILDADCRAIESTINHQLFRVWSAINYGAAVAAPRLRILSEPPEDEKARNEALQSRFEAYGAAVRAGVLTPTVEVEIEVRKLLRLPELSDAAKAAWIEGNGVRLPITLQRGGDASAMAMAAEPEKTFSDPTGEAARELFRRGAIQGWLGPVADKLTKLETATDEAFGAELAKLAADPGFGDTSGVENVIAETMYGAMAQEADK